MEYNWMAIALYTLGAFPVARHVISERNGAGYTVFWTLFWPLAVILALLLMGLFGFFSQDDD